MAGQIKQFSNIRQTTYRKNPYVQGNAVKKQEPKHKIEVRKSEHLSHSTRKNRDKAIHMNGGYVMFLFVALSLAGVILIGYISLQSDISTAIRLVAQYESQLNIMKSDNDEELSRINSEINLEDIKEIAINELGMTHAKEGQVIEVASENSDYVRQYEKLPDNK